MREWKVRFNETWDDNLWGFVREPDPPKERRLHPFPWKDTGCSVAPKCLECPLPQCKYEVEDSVGGHERRRYVLAVRDDGIRQEYAAGATVRDLVERHKLSRRVIFRAISGSYQHPCDTKSLP